MSNRTDLEVFDLLPEWWWFRDSHVLEGARVRVSGTLVSKKSISELSIVCRHGDSELPFNLSDPSEPSRSRFWYLPDTHVRGVQIEYQVDDPAGESMLELSTSADNYLRCLPFVQVHDWKTREPVPPTKNIERVSGFGANAYNYFCNGASDFSRFVKTAADHGINVFDEEAIVLDWGCGCGRLTRWFPEKGAGQYLGIDIDAENIAWCKESLKGASFDTVGLYPPTELEDHSFDLVIANSVLTHLTRVTMDKWLREIRRIIKPNGLALLSFHGDFSNAYFVSRHKDAMLKILDTGFYDKLIGKEMAGVLTDPEYYRQTYMSDKSAREIFEAAGFTIKDVIVGFVSRCQNLAVLSPADGLA